MQLKIVPDVISRQAMAILGPAAVRDATNLLAECQIVAIFLVQAGSFGSRSIYGQ